MAKRGDICKSSIIDDTGKLAYTVRGFADAIGVSRASICKVIRSDNGKRPELPSIFVCGRRLIIRTDGIAWLKKHRPANSNGIAKTARKRSTSTSKGRGSTRKAILPSTEVKRIVNDPT